MIETVEAIRCDAIRITATINRLKTEAVIESCQIREIQKDIKECGQKMDVIDNVMLARYFTFLETQCHSYFVDFMKRIKNIREAIDWLMSQPSVPCLQLGECQGCLHTSNNLPEPYCILGISLEPTTSGVFYEADRICLGE